MQPRILEVFVRADLSSSGESTNRPPPSSSAHEPRGVWRWIGPLSPLRTLLDAAWLIALVIVCVQLFTRPSALSSISPDVRLALVQGVQLRGVYRERERLGGILQRIGRDGPGWRIVEQFFAKGDVEVGKATLWLREDLSLHKLRIAVDLAKLATMTGMGGDLIRALAVDRLDIEGKCSATSGDCEISGRLGPREFDQVIPAGRGPVLPSAIYPLLAQGVLGRKADLHVFDPFSLTRRAVTYEVVGRRPLRLGKERFEATVVRQDFEGLITEVWLDRRGRVLKEQLPLGVWIEHESWGDE